MVYLRNIIKMKNFGSGVWRHKIMKLVKLIQNEVLTESNTTVDASMISKIKNYTKHNNHTKARAIIANDILKNKKLYKFYIAIHDINEYFGHSPPELLTLRRNVDDLHLKAQLKQKIENWKEVWGAI